MTDYVLEKLYGTLNAKHFGGAMPGVALDFGIPEWHQTGAPVSTVYDNETQEVDGVYFDERFLDPRVRFADHAHKCDVLADLMLHEMVHVALFIEYGVHEHDEVFVARCNAIGDAQEWPRCVLPFDDDQGNVGLNDCRFWPSDVDHARKVFAAVAKRARRAARNKARA